MTELSGGQTRALLIADATVICSTPVVLLDEVENAGINHAQCNCSAGTARFSFLTHEIRGIALLSDYRIIMQQGRIVQKFETSAEEQTASRYVNRLDESLTYLRERLRQGHRLIAREIQEVA